MSSVCAQLQIRPVLSKGPLPCIKDARNKMMGEGGKYEGVGPSFLIQSEAELSLESANTSRNLLKSLRVMLLLMYKGNG